MMSTNDFSARILADSITERGHRLTTMEVVLHRFVLSEINTHRQFSRNSASSRAIPISKTLSRILENPAMPVKWGRNQKGMQAYKELSSKEQRKAEKLWLKARDNAIKSVNKMEKIGKPDEDGYRGVHKQLANRLIEPWMFQTIILTATEFSNFFALRSDAPAQPEIRKASDAMREVYNASTPKLLAEGEWHLPLIFDEDYEAAKEFDDPDVLYKVSAARCARVSYLTHEGKRDLAADVALHDSLAENGHMSPLEHPARPMTEAEWDVIEGAKAHALARMAALDIEMPWLLNQMEFAGNFRGWVQYRKLIRNEDDFGKVMAESNA